MNCCNVAQEVTFRCPSTPVLACWRVAALGSVSAAITRPAGAACPAPLPSAQSERFALLARLMPMAPVHHAQTCQAMPHFQRLEIHTMRITVTGAVMFNFTCSTLKTSALVMHVSSQAPAPRASTFRLVPIHKITRVFGAPT